MNNSAYKIIVSKIFIFFCAVYLLSASIITFSFTDAVQLNLDVARSIVEQCDVTVTNGLRGTDGREYSWKGIGQPLLSVPFYVLGNFFNIAVENVISLLNPILTAGTAALIFLFAATLGYSYRASFLAALCYGLGTFAWPLSKHPFDHPVETFFILLSVFFMYQYCMQKKMSYIVCSSFSIGFAVITRPTSVLVLLPLFIMIYMLHLKDYQIKDVIRIIGRELLLFSISLLPFIILFFWYNYYRFGSIFETGYQLVGKRLGLNFFVSTPLLTGLAGFLISPGKGFFYYSPIAILFFFSIRSFFKKHPALSISFICIILSYLFFLAKNIYWHGDWAWGPRYLLALTPFFVIPLAEIFDSSIWLKKNLFKKVILFLFSISLIIQLSAISVNSQKHFFFLKIKKNIPFSKVTGDGAQPIVEPSPETYFEWKKSALVTQFQFVFDAAHNMTTYTYSDLSDDGTVLEIFESDMSMNVFDFWWIYGYYFNKNYLGFLIALMLLLLALYSFIKIWQYTKTPTNK
jgi:hypothetical protein